MNPIKYGICILFSVILSLNGLSQSKTDGWEEGSRYNRLFSYNNLDTLSGIIIRIAVTAPMQGMSEGIQVQVKTVTDTITVHLCPKWMSNIINLDLHPNDAVIIEGCKAVCKGAHIFMASKITYNNITYELRDEKGAPIWDKLR